ncbi:MAG: hypothetical protein LWY06_12020 [Firmicutes bacterium]|nr:hypothetical protein [Bacillota bacterium]
MGKEDNRKLLESEYLHLQKVIEEFDGRALTIKAWSVSFSLAAITGAFVSKAKPVFLIASLSSVVFWLIEALWKSFQQAYFLRINEIEKYFENEVLGPPVPFQISKSWKQSWTKDLLQKLIRYMFWLHVCLPHIVICILGIILYFTIVFPKSCDFKLILFSFVRDIAIFTSGKHL